MLNLAAMLDDSARDQPTKNAIVCQETCWSYEQVNGVANQVANLLASRGIHRGDKVALSCPNIAWFPIVYYGILKAGAVVVPLNVLLKSHEIAYHLQDSDARAYLCCEGTDELPLGRQGWAAFQEANNCEHFMLITADPAAPSSIEGVTTLGAALADQPSRFDTVATEPTDTAVILYTSGTTGKPKGAELTHANMVLNALVCHRTFGGTPDDVHLVTLPLFHTFGQTVQMNAGLGVAATLVLLPRFDPAEALKLMRRHEVTFFAGVPTMYWSLLTTDYGAPDLPAIAARLRIAISGGAALPANITEKFREVFGVEILEGYGLSETSPLATFNRPGEVVTGSIGRPVWGVELTVVDRDWNEVPDGERGEIAVRGHNVMKGYFGRPEATSEVMRDGWFRTGDVGLRDSDGHYFIVDRAKDMIIRGGFNVYPRELEETLMTHPAVSLAAVVGVPDERYGEEVKAYIIPEPNAPLTEADLLAWCKENMAGHKYPRQFEFRDTRCR